MCDNNMSFENLGNKNLTDDETEKVAGGFKDFVQYTCVNPACSEYLNYLQFQPAGNRCPVCGGIMGKVNLDQ